MIHYCKPSDYIIVIESKEWSVFAPAFMRLATSGPGVAPAQDIVNRIEKFLPFSQATTVVDMGCGPGQLTHAVLEHHFAKLPPSARIVGADNNEQMLQQYTGRKQKEIADGNVAWQRVEVIQTDVQDCSAFADESVSHMLANFVVFLVPEPVQAVRAMKRVIAPGGVLAMSSWQGSEWQDLMYYPKKVRPDLIMPEPPATWTSPEGVINNWKMQGLGTSWSWRVLAFCRSTAMKRYAVLS
ncbi:S-adenosyl-L-methionine-dependent methyltransferase [Xylariaceae sp. AK1471]|nr:S-adenosyl-L-methionine-dependent methyltransferase [Xylariaceae sp. AK1471]